MSQDFESEANNDQLEAAKEVLGLNSVEYKPESGTPWFEIEESLKVIDAIPPDKLDLTTRNGIAIYMLQATDEEDWKRRTNVIQRANGNAYPSFWLGLITGQTWSNSGVGIVAVTKERWRLSKEKNSSSSN